MRTKRRGIEIVAFISDIHSGSTAALMPPKFKLSDGNVIEANPLQRWFWNCWTHAIGWMDELIGKDPFALVLNGDMVEGDHHRTDEIISKRLTDHVDLAAEILTPIARRAENLYLTKGTECHVGDTEAALGIRLGADKDPESGRSVFNRLTLDVCGVRVVARHHVTTTSRPWLESNGLGMELASEQLSAVRNGEVMPRVLAVAHRHVPGHAQTADGVCFATPAWQGLTRHGHKVVPASRCKPGLYVMDWRGVAVGDLPKIHRRIYEAPKPRAIAI